MARNLNWFQGRAIARTGKAIRRDAWRKWLTKGFALWFLDRDDPTDGHFHYVVPQSEFGSAEFLASDWTDEPWSDPVTGVPVTPPSGYVPPPVSDPGGGGGGPPVGDPGGPGDGGGTWGPVGGGGGPGGPGGTTPRPHPTHTPPSDQTPVVTVRFIRSAPDYAGLRCFMTGPTSPLTMYWEVTVMGGPPGVGTLSVVCQGHTQLGTAFPGYSRVWEFTGIAVDAASAIDCTAEYTINGTPHDATGAHTFQNDCYP